MKTYWWTTSYKNFGDELTPIIIGHFLPGKKIELAKRKESGKLLAVGSIMAALQPGDIVWGSGSNQPDRKYNGRGCKFLAFRGPLTRSQIKGIHPSKMPEVYGDPGILLPLIYNPKVEKKNRLGILPHYVDAKTAKEFHQKDNALFIDILGDWKKIIRQVKSCRWIASSSLHGIIAAEAYGIPAIWMKYETSDKIRGKEFKYQDYFLGTGREKQKAGQIIPGIKDLGDRQKKLIEALKSL